MLLFEFCEFFFDVIEAFGCTSPVKKLFITKEVDGNNGDDKSKESDTDGFKGNSDDSAWSSYRIDVPKADTGDGSKCPPDTIFYGGELCVCIEFFNRDNDNSKSNSQEDEGKNCDNKTMTFQDAFHLVHGIKPFRKAQGQS